MKNSELALLVKAAQDNKNSGFELLYSTVWRTVYYQCRKQLGNHQDAQDAAQDVLAVIYQKLDELRHPEAFNTFLSKTTFFVCSKMIRKNTPVLQDDIDDFNQLENLAVTSDEFLPEEVLLKSELEQEILSLVETLPPLQRESILFFYFQGLSVEQISQATGSSQNAIKNRLFSARKTLRDTAKNLLKKGELSITMAAIPILTQLFERDLPRVATPEIGMSMHQNLVKRLKLNPKTGNPGNSTATNIIIGVATALIAANTIMLGIGIYNQVQNNPAEQITLPSSVDIITLIKALTTKPEVLAFCNTYNFSAVGSVRTNGDTEYTLYVLSMEDAYVYIATCENPAEYFITYKTAPVSNGLQLPEDITAWF